MLSRRKNKRVNKFRFHVPKEAFLFLILLLLIAIFCLIFIHIYNTRNLRSNFEKDALEVANNNSTPIFSLDKIYMFSGGGAVNNNNPKPIWDLNLYQYTDIAVYINNHSENGLSSENTIKELYISDISYGIYPEKGSPTLLYKDINDFGKSNFIEENIIHDNLKYNIIDTESNPDYTKPNIHNTLDLPITLGFVNKDIKTNFAVANTNDHLIFDGTLLKKAHINLSSIKTSVSFNINIVNNKNENFICNVSLEIPIENDTDNENTNSILDGYIKKELTDLSKYVFYKKTF